MQVTNFL